MPQVRASQMDMTSSPQPGVFYPSGAEHLESLYFQVVGLLLADARKRRKRPKRLPEWGLTPQGGPPRNFVRHLQQRLQENTVKATRRQYLQFDEDVVSLEGGYKAKCCPPP